MYRIIWLVIPLMFAALTACSPSNLPSSQKGAEATVSPTDEQRRVAFADPLQGKTWVLESLVENEDDDVVTKAVPSWPQVTVHFEDGRMSGRTGCNSYGAPYRVEMPDFLIALDDLEITEAECTSQELDRVQNRLIHGLHSAETFSIVGNSLRIVYPGGALIFRRTGDETELAAAVENAVYASLLDEFYTREVDQFVIRAESKFNHSGENLEQTLAIVKDLLAQFGEGFVGLDPTTEADFNERNVSPSSLEKVLEIDFPVTFINEVSYLAFQNEGSGMDWETYNKQFPNTQGIISLSLIGFDTVREQALVYTGLESEAYTSGWYSLMVKESGIWQSAVSFALPD